MTHRPEPQSHLPNQHCGKQEWVVGAHLCRWTLSGVGGKAGLKAEEKPQWAQGPEKEAWRKGLDMPRGGRGRSEAQEAAGYDGMVVRPR